jgi:hypothetical protein
MHWLSYLSSDVKDVAVEAVELKNGSLAMALTMALAWRW